MSIFKIPLFSQFLRYTLASSVALAVDLSLFYVCATYGVAPFFSVLFGFVGGVFTSFMINSLFVFNERRFGNDMVAGFSVFLLTGVMGLVLTEMLIMFLTGSAGIDLRYAKLMSIGPVFILNFAVRKIVVFSGEKKEVQYG